MGTGCKVQACEIRCVQLRLDVRVLVTVTAACIAHRYVLLGGVKRFRLWAPCEAPRMHTVRSFLP